MLSCREVTRIIASDELCKAGWRCRLKVWIHQWLCKPCRSYGEEIETVGQNVRQMMLCDDQKCSQALKDRIVSRCKKVDSFDDS